MSQRGTTVFTDIDWARPGKQVGHAWLPHSGHDDAWGAVALPLAVVGNGEGPTVFVTGAIHGDEYEGPIVINELIRSLDPSRVRGRLILMPAANAPALRAASRVSPLDGKNLARVFPGNPYGTPTEQIAAFIHDVIFPLCNAYIDLHAGGSSLFIEESAQVVVTPTLAPEVRERAEDMARWFGAKFTVITDNMGDPRTSCGAAAQLGLAAIAAEMGENGSVSPRGVKRTRECLARVLARLGIVPAELPATPPPSRRVRIVSHGGNLLSPGDGYFEPLHSLGDTVAVGDIAGYLHSLSEPALVPRELRFMAGGTVYSQRTFGMTRQGNSLCVLVEDEPEATA
ncbi:succinylglutamate desuccinylase/aspartoacylase domain-containing protein [Variovorax ginsengisoli]|uniref:Deacylase n=1 Tax=Variovorax ginsengisoli TaxID=363844 RepID=A0ABT9S4Q5_9BURK|nr:succinylglutamate desuccinylase/aspartoacylase family protein [Variovorax ginsengisoli]MDP9899338.1 putative deacylase [Variovorax ginsengisoli]